MLQTPYRRHAPGRGRTTRTHALAPPPAAHLEGAAVGAVGTAGATPGGGR